MKNKNLILVLFSLIFLTTDRTNGQYVSSIYDPRAIDDSCPISYNIRLEVFRPVPLPRSTILSNGDLLFELDVRSATSQQAAFYRLWLPKSNKILLLARMNQTITYDSRVHKFKIPLEALSLPLQDILNSPDSGWPGEAATFEIDYLNGEGCRVSNVESLQIESWKK